MVPDVGNPSFALFLDDGLVGGASLQVVVADQGHVAAVGALLGGDGRLWVWAVACVAETHSRIWAIISSPAPTVGGCFLDILVSAAPDVL